MKRWIFTLSTAALLLGATPAFAQEVKVSEEAREKFKAGVALLQDPDGARTEDAYLAFKAAYAISPSPNILGNLGLCAMRLERDEEAIWAYGTYLEKGSNIEPAERAQIESDLKTLKTTLSRLELSISPAQAMILDERQLSSGSANKNRYGPAPAEGIKLGLRAGRHKLTISLEGYQDQVLELELTPGGSEKRSVELKPKPSGDAGPGAGPGPGPTPTEMERPVPVSVWAMVGVTGALAVGAGVVGGLAMANKSDYDDANDGSDPAAAEDLRSQGQAMNIATDVLIGTSVAAAAVTLVLFLTRPEVPAKKEQGVSATFVPTPLGAAVFGTF